MAEAATHYVPDNFATIQAALNGAVDGDTILVRPGTYFENNINFNGKAITLKSLEGPDVTIIDGGGIGRVFGFFNKEKRDTIIDGFTITNGKSNAGGGMYIYHYVQVTVRNCIITGNEAGTGGGVFMVYVTNPLFENTRIENNTATSSGGGIRSFLGSLAIVNGTVANNHAGTTGGGLRSEYYSYHYVENTVFYGNTAENSGGAYSGYYGATLRGTNLLMFDNSASMGGAVYLERNARIDAAHLTVTANTADEGGGMYFEDSIKYQRLRNIIDYFNSTLSVYGALKPSYSNIEGGAAGTGNIDADPLFVDFANGDFHLSGGSPCINTGVNVVGYDIEGNPRPIGTSSDMGAFEYQGCSDVPTVEITSVSPDAIWPPNNKETEVVVSGFISMPEGCTLLDASYTVNDEYGVYTGSGDLIVGEDGSFELIMTVEASRLGSDKDGRAYDVTISATDEAGDASASTEAVVLHDMR
jgi:hypothetical protein